ncbi:hypothetical protein [Dendronalium sp. ChiSLP03b]|uniref:hypothetical protein n=1 Tax=Dendronalium sp. ChiSLP03b TaxID=3075381 RepID=UPI003919AC9F
MALTSVSTISDNEFSSIFALFLRPLPIPSLGIHCYIHQERRKLRSPGYKSAFVPLTT